MWALLISWAGNVLQLVVVTQGVRQRLFSRYPFFYAYATVILVINVPISVFYMALPNLYLKYYWPANFLTLVLGYGILLEILKHVLSPYPGAEKFAIITGLIAFVAILCVSLIYPLLKSESFQAATYMDLERDLRAVQAIFLFAVLAVIFHYGIAIGRNMKGMILGYGFYIGMSLVTLAIRSYTGASFDVAWETLQPLSYDVSLLIWAISMWSYHPNPKPDSTVHLEADYEAFVAKTRDMMGAMRSYLARAVKP